MEVKEHGIKKSKPKIELINLLNPNSNPWTDDLLCDGGYADLTHHTVRVSMKTLLFSYDIYYSNNDCVLVENAGTTIRS
jgi:hypothetical protein